LRTGFAKLVNRSGAANAGGFTLVELLVVMGVIAVLIALQVPVLAAGKGRSRIAICASHVRQLGLAIQIYANENNGSLPANPSWPFFLSVSTADALLIYGAQTNTFYCPGTEPRFTDTQNWAGPGNTLWNFGSQLRITGYSFAFSGPFSTVDPSYQNKTILPEAVANYPSPGVSTIVSASERVLLADATISASSIQPGYLHPENNYTSISGGYTYNGVTYPHVSPHLKGNVPAGSNLGFKDGHVDWRDFSLMKPRAGGFTFWW
jgi:prepilin-type N-terminal cleavage/methylation domain-containing protein